MAFLIALVHAAILLFVAGTMYRRQTALRSVFWPALLFKLFCGVLLGLLYRYYYDASDTFTYFHDAGVLAEAVRRDLTAFSDVLFGAGPIPGVRLAEPRAIFLSRIASVVDLATGHHYWLISAWFSFVCFVASWYLVRTAARVLPQARNAAVVAVLFLPSATFWSSGLIKEALAMAGLFFLSALVLRLWARERWRVWEILLTAASLWVTWNLKYYYLVVFVPLAVTTLLYARLAPRASRWWKWAVWGGASATLVVVALQVHPNVSMSRLLNVVVENNRTYASLSDAGDYIAFDDLRPELASILLHAPKALFSGLFRPWPWEAGNVLQVLASLENMVLLFLTLTALSRLPALAQSPGRVLVAGACAYVIVLCVFLTLSAPNFGTLSRYRVGFMFIFAWLVLSNNPTVDFIGRFRQRLARQ